MNKRVITAALAIPLALGPTAVATAAQPLPHPATAPVPGQVLRRFQAAEPDWVAGHRGVDVRAAVGDPVRAAAAGVVTFSGELAGRGVVVVSHGEVRTTYEPVLGTLTAGSHVGRGDVIGSLQAGHDGCPAGCLHWGLRRGEKYLDPLLLLSGPEVRLVGRDYRPPQLPARAAPAGRLLRPPGVVTSTFGRRLHPVLGTWGFHDGVDFGLACGEPIPAIGGGQVTWAAPRGGLGLTVEIDHGTVGGHHLVSRYGHAQSLAVSAGMTVGPGQRLGAVGSTGWSTGCHLHLTTIVDGVPADPLATLG